MDARYDQSKHDIAELKKEIEELKEKINQSETFK
jgi:peptidoglycan hydrolase CwlO-like protein